MRPYFITCCILAWFNGYYLETRLANWYNAGTNSAILNSDAMTCAVNYMRMEYVGARMRTNGRDCESLPYEWLTNQTFVAGYMYMIKEWNQVILNMLLYKSYYTAYLPGVFHNGNSITITITTVNDPPNYSKIYLSRASSDKFLAVLPYGPSPADVTNHNGYNSEPEIELSYVENGRWSWRKYVPGRPYVYNGTTEISFVAGNHYIDMKVNNLLFYRYDLRNKSPTTEVRMIEFDIGGGGIEIVAGKHEFMPAPTAYLNSIEFKVSNP